MHSFYVAVVQMLGHVQQGFLVITVSWVAQATVSIELVTLLCINSLCLLYSMKLPIEKCGSSYIKEIRFL